MKENIVNEYIRKVKLIFKSNINAGNFMSGLNACAIGVIRYRGGITEELQDMYLKSSKVMTLNRCLHQIISVAGLYMKRK